MRTVATLTLVLAAAAAGRAYAQPTKGEDESASLVEEGRASLRKGKLDAAAKALDQAIALNPRRVEAYVLRSAVHAAKKEHRRGVDLMRKAFDLAPNDPDVQTALGSQLLAAGDAAAGVPMLQSVTGKDAKKYDAQLVLGHHFHDTGRWPDSIAAFEAYFVHRPAELAKDDPRHRVDLGDAYLRYRQPQKALELFQRAVAEKKPKEDLRARIGVAWAMAAIDCKKARPLLRELDTAPPNGKPVSESHPEVWLVDGQCAIALGDIAGALALGRRYLDRVPDAGAAGHALVGEALAARGNLGEARRELE
ncbi:MAG: tetratricopeptide repeat protein, partial [Deltaproteobacteria bacterium]|nr:tetratricopeptide repeat protein [Deltaproteobacteria bacterium]